MNGLRMACASGNSKAALLSVPLETVE